MYVCNLMRVVIYIKNFLAWSNKAIASDTYMYFRLFA